MSQGLKIKQKRLMPWYQVVSAVYTTVLKDRCAFVYV